jgi:hypothetical protein
MGKHSNLCLTILTGGVALGWAVLSALTARADQIVVILDEHGHKVFVNTGDPPKRPGLRSAGYRPTRELPPPAPEIKSLVEKTANRFQVDPQLVDAVIQVESEYNPRAVSRSGAMGLMQLIPATATRLGVSNPFDPKQNIEAGVSHLKYLLNLFGGDVALSLAAYNSGVHSVERYGGIPSFEETKHYVHKVWNLYQPGSDLNPSRVNLKQLSKAPIYRYVDTAGVVHFTNVE